MSLRRLKPAWRQYQLEGGLPSLNCQQIRALLDAQEPELVAIVSSGPALSFSARVVSYSFLFFMLLLIG
ncbi:MAG: hypothetical protein AAFO94_09845 [Bacteroidota bacterium]